jgi:RNA polymerase sigma factor (TIGR02999 family)
MYIHARLTERSMGEVTELLQRAAHGDAAAQEPLYRLLYPELMQLARGRLANAGSISLDASAILHEAWLRLAHVADAPKTNRRVFYAYASRVMHSVIVDYVRERGAQKRGGGQDRLTLSNNLPDVVFTENSINAIEQVMLRLRQIDERAYRVVEMRYFAGLAEHEVADALGVSLPTVQRDWRRARMFLFEQLSEK